MSHFTSDETLYFPISFFIRDIANFFFMVYYLSIQMANNLVLVIFIGFKLNRNLKRYSQYTLYIKLSILTGICVFANEVNSNHALILCKFCSRFKAIYLIYTTPSPSFPVMHLQFKSCRRSTLAMQLFIKIFVSIVTTFSLKERGMEAGCLR